MLLVVAGKLNVEFAARPFQIIPSHILRGGVINPAAEGLEHYAEAFPCFKAQGDGEILEVLLRIGIGAVQVAACAVRLIVISILEGDFGEGSIHRGSGRCALPRLGRDDWRGGSSFCGRAARICRAAGAEKQEGERKANRSFHKNFPPKSIFEGKYSAKVYRSCIGGKEAGAQLSF